MTSDERLRTLAREWLIGKDCRYQSETFLPNDVESLTKLLHSVAGPTSETGSIPAGATESGWLIERRMQLPPEYLCVPDWSGFQWTQDSLKALRFSRREDAEQVAHIFENEDVYITEHQWG